MICNPLHPPSSSPYLPLKQHPLIVLAFVRGNKLRQAQGHNEPCMPFSVCWGCCAIIACIYRSCCIGPRCVGSQATAAGPSSPLAALQGTQTGSEAEAQCLAGDRKFFGHAEPSDLGAAFE